MPLRLMGFDLSSGIPAQKRSIAGADFGNVCPDQRPERLMVVTKGSQPRGEADRDPARATECGKRNDQECDWRAKQQFPWASAQQPGQEAGGRVPGREGEIEVENSDQHLVTAPGARRSC
jgi:hypothetical protein